MRRDLKILDLRYLTKLVCFLLLLTVSAQSQTQPESRKTTHATFYIEPERLRRFEKQLEQLRSLLKIPGMSAVIVKDQKPLWAKGFGYADVEKRVPATANTLYYIASLTKTFATTALMQLVEQGRLDLDEPMSRYSGEFKDDTVKVKHLLSHTSGVTPGERFRYDGARFSLLTAVIEKKTGKSFRQLMAEMFLDPLNMSDSLPSQDVLTAAQENLPLFAKDKLNRYRIALTHFAQPYRLYGSETIHTVYPWEGISAAAGILSTAPDLAKFDAAINRHVYLKKETQDKSWTPFVSNSGRPLVHGLGWFVQNYRGLKVVWHFGNSPDSFSATYIKLPEKGLSLILLANSDALSQPFVRSGILGSSPFVCSFLRIFVFEELLGHTLSDPNWADRAEDFSVQVSRLKEQPGYSYEGELAAHAVMLKWLHSKRKSVFTSIKVDPRTFVAYVGQYELPDRTVLTISKNNSRLLINQPGYNKIELFAESSLRFFAKATDVELMFVKSADGKTTQMEIYQDGRTVIAKKIK